MHPSVQYLPYTGTVSATNLLNDDIIYLNDTTDIAVANQD